MMKNDTVLATLTRLVTQDRSLCTDLLRLEGFLRDYAGQHRREINVLVTAAREGVPAELLKVSGSEVPSLVVDRLVRRLHDNAGIDQALARWAVEGWAAALGKTVASGTLISPAAPPLQPPPVAPPPPLPGKQKHFARFGVGAAIATVLVLGFLWISGIIPGGDPPPTPILSPAPTLTPSPAPTRPPTSTPLSGCDSKARDNTEPRLWRQEPKRMNGPKVEFLQRRLLELGYQLPNSGADGWFGRETEAAVKEFQRRNGLEVDGIVGSITWACLKNPNAARASD